MNELLDRLFCDATAAGATAVERACAAGAAAPDVGGAFLAGYHFALRALVPGLTRAATLCATEAEGAHPRAIRTRLDAQGEGLRLNGQKRWASGATEAEVLLVIASEGTDPDGRSRLRCVCVDPHARGVLIEAMPAPPFTPEIVHAAVTLENVAVAVEDVLPGDGYTRYLKPFRTVEDIHVTSALLGYLVGVACRCRWPTDVLEDLLALIDSLRALAAQDPLAARTHVGLAGTLRWLARKVDGLEPHWALADEATRTGWQRDRPLLQVAQRARQARLAAAWKALGAAVETGPGGPASGRDQ